MTDTLRDAFGRTIDYLRLSVTDRCNLRCHYCMPAEGMQWLPKNDLLSDKEVITLIREVFLPLGVKKVRLTGGEPTIRPDLNDLVRKLSHLGVADISLSTNGILFATQAAALAEAGLRRINISMDSLQPEKFAQITRGGKLDRVLASIDAAIAANLDPIKINVVVIPGTNDDEILDFARLTLDLPLHVRFIEMMQVGDRRFFEQKGFISMTQLLENLESEYTLIPHEGKIQGNGPAKVYQIAGARGTVGFITPMSRNFCDTCNRIRLTADGQIKACLMRPQESNLRDLLRSGASPEEMQELVRTSLGIKPQHHEWGAGLPITRTMSRIGG